MASPIESHFDALAAGWPSRYRDGGPMEERVSLFVESLQARVPPGGRILDFGCGTGEIARALRAAGYVVTGADISSVMLQAGRTNPENSGIQFLEMDARMMKIPLEAGSFDGVIASSVLEYLVNPAGWLMELRRVLRSGGWLLATVPDPDHPIRRREAWIRRFTGWLPLRMVPFRRRYLEYLRLSKNRSSLEEWESAVRQAGFELASVVDRERPLSLLAAKAGAR
jgi:ubiquinone/menaquinone biosynthesis C-methylase UbiE